MADTLALPLHHIVGEGEERRRPLHEHAEPLLGSVDQHLRLPPRGLAAVDSRIGRLLLALVAPGGLAQLLEAPFDVEDIIPDLEGEPEIATRLGDRRHGLRVAAREPRAHAERGADEGGGLWRWMYSSVSAEIALPSDSMSTTWPPTIPTVPAASAISATTSRITRGSLTRSALSAMSRNASVRSASPARIAIASPKTLWLVRRPRR